MRVIDFLKQKSTRVIAFVSACVIFAVCAAVALTQFAKIQKSYENHHELYYRYNGTIAEEQELFSKLWLIGNMYLRNLNSKGEFTGSDELKKSTETALKELGLMDSNGKITIGENENFKYYVSWEDNSISSDNKSFDEIFNSDYYSTVQTNGKISHSNMHGYGYYSFYDNYHWYYTDYGMTYYDFPHTINGKMATAVYDYDTKDLDSYVDNLGVRIYYKKDGSTPIPNPYDEYLLDRSNNIYRYDEYVTEDYYNNYYDEYIEETTIPELEEFPNEHNISEVKIPSKVLKNNDYILYDKNSDEWIELPQDIRYTGNEIPLKICITPSAQLISICQQMETDNQLSEQMMARYFLNVIPFLVLIVVLIGYFWIADGYDVKKKKFVLSAFDKIWVEVILVCITLFVAASVFSLDVIDDLADNMSYYLDNYHTSIVAIGTFAWTTLLALIVICINSIIRRFKCKSFWKTTLCYKIWNKFIKKILSKIYRKIKSNVKFLKNMAFDKDMKDNKIFARRFLIKLGLFLLVTLFIMSLNAEPSVAWVIISVVYIYFSLKDIKAVTELSKHINDIYGGDYSAKEVNMVSPTYTMTEKLNNISDGIQTAVDKRLQSERMKIELVTNVSHDLKTPLTSIISYINLLSMEELSPVATDYVKILEQKSERLREIVADVFDIAKATSRTDINFEMIDAVILVEQVMGDMSDRIENSGREIRKTISAETAPVYADGKKLYRVLQNIIDNALKYSLENTRIYLTLKKENGNAVITLKNISSYEITFSPEEITERFTRGDESRTTEGSGLGLSIAKSFTEACGGSFEIIIDGDVFEADVTLPITIKEK